MHQNETETKRQISKQQCVFQATLITMYTET